MQLQTRTKLLLSFVTIALGSAVVGAFGLSASRKLVTTATEATVNVIPSLGGLGRLREGFTSVRYYTSEATAAALQGEHERVAALWSKREEARKRAEDGAAAFERTELAPDEQTLWDGARPALRDYLAVNAKVWEAIHARDPHRAERIHEEYAAQLHASLVEPLERLAARQGEEADAMHRAVVETASSATALLWTVMIVTLLVAVALGIYLALAVSRPLEFLVAEARRLRQAVAQGKLDVRGDTARTTPELRPVLQGINETMDAFVRPIQVTADYVERISRGDLPPRITDEYQGDFNLIKESLNTCIEAVGALVADSVALSRAAVEGKLSTRADASRHRGDFQKIVAGVNATLDAVVGPIREATEVLEQLARRDLRPRVTGSYQGDHAAIKQALNATADALHEAVAQVAQAVDQVSSAAGQIASASESVAAGASEQSASLEETRSSLESVTATTKHAADNAQQANALAQQARGAAVEGGGAVEQMTGAMGKIRASAEGTSQIIKDINEIAFQTNLLALNAAVEAARAGAAGRGFAVVAEEVRSLAQRCKEAASKTEGLIRESVKQAGEGEVTARHVHDQLAAITTSVSKVSDIVAEISASAAEQAVGIEQVSKAVVQVSQVTQQNAASSEESSSAAAELSGQSEELAAMVATFQIDRAASAAARRAAAARPAARTAPPRPAPLQARAVKLAGGKPRPGAKTARAAHHPARPAPSCESRHALEPQVDPASVIPLDGDPGFKEF